MRKFFICRRYFFIFCFPELTGAVSAERNERINLFFHWKPLDIGALAYIPYRVYNEKHSSIKTACKIIMKTSASRLIHRLNRIDGQIGAVRRAIEQGDADCLAQIHQIKAARAALKSFAEAYVEEYALACAKESHASPRFAPKLREVVAAAFSL